MIIPMIKYSFLTHHSVYTDLLKLLQDAGLVHIIEQVKEQTEDLKKKLLYLSQLKDLVKYMEKQSELDSKKYSWSVQECIQKIQDLRTKKDKNEQSLIILQKEKQLLDPWGAFSNSQLKELNDKGVIVKFYTCPVRKFTSEWQDKYSIVDLGSSYGLQYFVLASTADEIVEIGADEQKIPLLSSSDIQLKIDELNEEHNRIATEISSIRNASLQTLSTEINAVNDAIAFEKAYEASIGMHDNMLKLLDGWVPVNKEKDVDAILDQNNIIYVKAKPMPHEYGRVPIVLKNNSLALLLEPIGQLYSLPRFGEIDLTPYFAPFYVLFYGMCMADAGYGLIFVLASLIIMPKVKEPIKSFMKLGFYLGLSTIFFGLLTGSLFGLEIAKTEWVIFDWLKPHILTGQQVFYLALIFGIVQIIFGMIIKAANKVIQEGWLFAIATIGWILLFLFTIVFSLIKDKNIIPAADLVLYFKIAALACGVMILFFNNPATNIFASFGGGLWDVYSTTTGVLGDVLSYIRLFALGVSGAILGLVFNNIALTVLNGGIPVVSQFFFVVILLFGHGINLFMAALGSFVHPMRLTFVEFYKNAGFNGGGKAYIPFSKSNHK